LSVTGAAFRQLFQIALCASLLLAPWAAVAAESDPAAAALELEKTLERLNALDLWFSDAERKRADLEKQVKRQDQDIASLNKAVRSTASRIDTTEADLLKLAEEQKALEVERHEQARLIGEHITATHRLSGQDFFKQLLNQESPDTFERMARYHRYFSEARLEVMASFQSTLTRLADTNAALEARRLEQSQQYADLVAEQEHLAAERTSRGELIAQLNRETESRTQEYGRLQESRQRLEALLAELRRRAMELDGTAFAAAKGKLPMPVTGRVRHAFGQTRADGRLTWHGLDISAPHGAPITAVFRGRVLFSDWLRGFGLLTILDHGSGYMTLYGNVDVLHKQVGDWVESGEVIAGAGNSGGKKDTGVYFEVRHKGQPKDPISWVAR
jgi:septal ring factor EnvC (AmiA/AmiB activator)